MTTKEREDELADLLAEKTAQANRREEAWFAAASAVCEAPAGTEPWEMLTDLMDSSPMADQ